MSSAHEGFAWWNYLHNDFLNENSHISSGLCATIILVGAAVAYRVVAPKVNFKSAQDHEFVPPAKFGIQNFFELIGEFVQELARDTIGHHYPKYLPVLLFIFMWTLLNNLLGMVPGFDSSTSNLNTTMGMGLCVFIYYNVMGFQAHGWKYLEQYTGHLHGLLLVLLGPAMFVIELISNSVRPMTLGIRLRTNIYSDHLVYHIFSQLFAGMTDMLHGKAGALGSFLGALGQALGPIPIVLLGMLVCVIQAFVFTLLTTIYVGMATAHDEH